VNARPLRRRAASLVAASLALCAAFPALGQQGPRAALFAAIIRDDPDGLRTALLRGADANAPDELGVPPVVAAAREKSWKALQALAELRGTRIDSPDPEGSTALMFAALHGDLSMVRYLVARKAEVNREGWTPLHFAAANGHAAVVRFLLEHHAYIDAESPNRTTPMMMAARQAHPTVVRLLVEEGADPTPRNDAGYTAASYARAAGDPALGDWLLRQADAFRRRYPAPRS
jgi:ankyrin repeat protein